MTLEEAIKVLEKDRNDHHSFPTDIVGKAEQIGIEALRDKKAERVVLWGLSRQLLPGETKE